MVAKDIAIEWNRRALRQLIDLHAKIGVNIHEKVSELGDCPHSDNIEEIVNLTTNSRIEVGRHRILFSVSDRVTIISIDEVAHRDSSTN